VGLDGLCQVDHGIDHFILDLRPLGFILLAAIDDWKKQ